MTFAQWFMQDFWVNVLIVFALGAAVSLCVFLACDR
jgi:hypothetical protein